MSANNSDTPKKVTVSFGEKVNPVPTYSLFLIRDYENDMEVQLAKKTETDTEVNVLVESVFRIEKEAIPQFVRQISKYLQTLIDEEEQA